MGEGKDSQAFIDEVSALGDVSEIDLHINSEGGNVSDGIAIYNTLKQHKAKITVTVDGTAASIASVVAMAGDTIIMPLGSTMFIHDPYTWVIGNADEMRWTADHLDKYKSSIMDIYQARTKLSRNKISQLMTDETTLTAQEAVDLGFANKKEHWRVQNSFNAKQIKNQIMMKGALYTDGWKSAFAKARSTNTFDIYAKRKQRFV